MSDANGNGGVRLDFSGSHSAEPAAESFDGAEILERISDYVRRYVHLSDAQARIIALWIAHTHGISFADHDAVLGITSAAKRSGKTRLLEVLELVVARPWLTGRVTAACLVRKVDQVDQVCCSTKATPPLVATRNMQRRYAES